MGYRKIPNLYKSKTILMFKQCVAMEKCHGTSTHLSYNSKEDKLSFFSGGCNHEQFVKLFDQEKLLNIFRENAKEHPKIETITVYGEGVGGKMQGMSHTYGPNLFFIAFEVKLDKVWLDTERANLFVNKLGLEFVPWKIIDTTEDAINAAMMEESEVAVRKGMGHGKTREGVILRPIIELVHQGLDEDGGPIRVKHKHPLFAEREHTPRISDPEQEKILKEANAIADEWCTMNRLEHVLDHLLRDKVIPEVDMKWTEKVIKEMVQDIYIEAKGEIVESTDVRKAIGKKTVKLFKEHLMKG
jgi:hypothetical protein